MYYLRIVQLNIFYIAPTSTWFRGKRLRISCFLKCTCRYQKTVKNIVFVRNLAVSNIVVVPKQFIKKKYKQCVAGFREHL